MSSRKAPGLLSLSASAAVWMNRVQRVIPHQLKRATRSLRGRVAAYLLLAALLPVGVLVVSSALIQPALIRSGVESNLVDLSEAGSRLILQQLQEAQAQIQIMAADPIVASTARSREDKQARLDALKGFYPIFDDITLLGTSGGVLASTTYQYYWTGWQGNRWYQEALQGRTVISDAFVIPQLDKVVVLVATPVTTPSGSLVGVLSGQFNMEHIWSIIDELHPGERGFAFLVNESDTMIAYPDRELLFRKLSAITPDEFALTGSSGFVQYTELDGSSIAAGHLLIAPADLALQAKWRLVVAQPTDEAFAILQFAEAQFRAALVLAALVVLVVTFVLSQYLTHPLAKLLEATTAIANWSYRNHGDVPGTGEMRSDATGTIAMSAPTGASQQQSSQKPTQSPGLDDTPLAHSTAPQLQGTYTELTRRMAELMACRICVIATYDRAAGTMQAQAPGYGAPDELVRSFRYGADVPVTEGPWDFRLRGPLLTNDVADVAEFFPEWVDPFRLFNLLVVPMTLEGRITGLVYAANKPGGFTQDDSKLLTIFAGQAAVIIDNARLFEQTRHLAVTDPLTGLWNRRHLEERRATEAVRSRRSGHPLSVLVMDMDDLKLLNDTYGHLVADEAIVMVARVLLTVCREVDIVGRYGGDEFAVILPATDAQGTALLAERILTTLDNQPFPAPDGTEVQLSVSIGGASYPSQTDDPDQLFSLADEAMYRAKMAGGGQAASAAGRLEELPKQVNSDIDVLHSLLVTMDVKDHHSIKHSRDVTKRALALGREAGLSEGQLGVLEVAAVLHDVGKIGIPRDLLTPQRPLTREEKKMLEDHPRAGYILVEQIPQMKAVSHAVLYHHERYDGTGYPVGLSGEDIPLLARILRIADAFSNMITHRSDHMSPPLEAVLDELGAEAGTHFDPDLLQTFIDLVSNGEIE
jgi:diguanylate cyclase (GGDEF)-like protein